MAHRDNRFLSDLVMLRNNPVLVDEVLGQAREGNVDAQYALGLIFAEGRGLAEDLVQSYVWLSLAVMQGDEDAQLLRMIVGERMSAQEFEISLALAGDLEMELSGNISNH
jgi:TPR repeat protein